MKANDVFNNTSLITKIVGAGFLVLGLVALGVDSALKQQNETIYMDENDISVEDVDEVAKNSTV